MDLLSFLNWFKPSSRKMESQQWVGRTFLLEPILTPSGLVDAGDDSEGEAVALIATLPEEAESTDEGTAGDVDSANVENGNSVAEENTSDGETQVEAESSNSEIESEEESNSEKFSDRAESEESTVEEHFVTEEIAEDDLEPLDFIDNDAEVNTDRADDSVSEGEEAQEEMDSQTEASTSIESDVDGSDGENDDRAEEEGTGETVEVESEAIRDSAPIASDSDSDTESNSESLDLEDSEDEVDESVNSVTEPEAKSQVGKDDSNSAVEVNTTDEDSEEISETKNDSSNEVDRQDSPETVKSETVPASLGQDDGTAQNNGSEQNETTSDRPSEDEDVTANTENGDSELSEDEEQGEQQDDRETDNLLEGIKGINFETGTFVVGESGEIGIDFLFDGGAFKGELGIFSLENLSIDLESEESTIAFIRESADRALSSSELGHVVISDRTEGAKFSGKLGEQNDWNSGEYKGVKTFNMKAGDRFGVLFVPNGSVRNVADNPSLEGAQRPLYSLGTANPEDEFHLGQIADVTGEGNTFVMEDLRVDGKSDRDYNDIIFQVRGATGKAPHVSEVMDDREGWLETDLGKAIVEYTKPYITPETSDVESAGNTQTNPIVDEVGSDTEETIDASDTNSDSSGQNTAQNNADISNSSSGTSESNGTQYESSESTQSEQQFSVTGEKEDSGNVNSTEFVVESDSDKSASEGDAIAPQQQSETQSVSQENTVSEEGTGENSNDEVQSSTDPQSQTNVDRSNPVPDAIELPDGLLQFDFPKENQPLVGIIDTGFSADNFDIDYSDIESGFDFVDGDNNSFIESGEGSEHGTHVLGIIKAIQNNDEGIDGINDDAPIWVGRGVGSEDWTQSLVEFVDTAKASGQPNAVVNLSFALSETDADGNTVTRYELTENERAAIQYARDNNILLVVSSGNDGGVMPALAQASQEFDNIVTVGSAERFDSQVSIAKGSDRAEYSSYGYGLDILAEGGTLENPAVSTVGDGVGTMAGTSVATAKVTGAVSLVWAANPELSYRQVVEIIKSTATDLDIPNPDRETGAGLLNLLAAVHLAKATEAQPYDPPEIPGNNKAFYVVSSETTPAGIAREELQDEDRWDEILREDGTPFTDKNEPLVPGDKIVLPAIYEKGTDDVGDDDREIGTPNQLPEDLDFSMDLLYNPGEDLRFSGKVFDGDGATDLERIDFWLRKDGGAWEDISDAENFIAWNKDDRWGRFAFNYNLEGREPGHYEIKAVAYDRSGVAGEVKSDRFTVLSVSEEDALSPTVKSSIEQAMDLDSYDRDRLAVTREWLVSVRSDVDPAALAQVAGAEYIRKNPHIPNTHVWKFPDNIRPQDVAVQLQAIEGVEFSYPLVPVHLELFNPIVNNFWHLRDSGVLDARQQHKVDGKQINGKGVTIGIVDDGVEETHVAFGDRYRDDLSWDFNDPEKNQPEMNRATPESTNVEFGDGEFSESTIIYSELANNLMKPQKLISTIPVNLTGITKELSLNLQLPDSLPDDISVTLTSPSKQTFVPDDRGRSSRSRYYPGWGDPTFSKFETIDLKELDSEGNKDLSDEFKQTYANGDWKLTLRINDAIHVQPGTEITSEQLEQLKQTYKSLQENFSWSLKFSTDNPHGTSVAGIAAGNDIFEDGRGVASGAELTGLRLIGNTDPTDYSKDPLGTTIADALTHKNQEIDIFNNSWGPDYFVPQANMTSALQAGVETGRAQSGSIYVAAAGNDGYEGEGGGINYSAFSSARQVISVGAVDYNGKRAPYSTTGSALFITAPSDNGDKDKDNLPGIVTADLTDSSSSERGYQDGEWAEGFGGTSAAAPIVSGVVALMLEANPNLTARDVQHILAETANRDRVPEDDADWTGKSGDPIRHSEKYGFGIVDAKAAVAKAIAWKETGKTVGTEADVDRFELGDTTPFETAIPTDKTVWLEDAVNSDVVPIDNMTVEWVEVDLTTLNNPGDLDVELVHTFTDAEGNTRETVSRLAEWHYVESESDESDNNNDTTRWTYRSVRHWGESSQGEWKLRVSGSDNSDDSELQSWDLRLFGSAPTVTVETLDSEAAETTAQQWPNFGEFKVSRTGNTDLPLAIDLTASGEAVLGDDYRLVVGGVPVVGSQVTIPAGAESVTVRVEPIDDTAIENGSESLMLAVAANQGYKVGDTATTTIAIADNDGYIVSNTNDSGPGSLRAAIEFANSNPDTTTIEFDIPTTDPNYDPATGAFTIRPLSELPEITEPVVIDGTSQPGYAGKPIIELTGNNKSLNGLVVSGGNSTIRGLVINSFRTALQLKGLGNNTVQGNYIGTDATGNLDRGNTGGVMLDNSDNNTIGGIQSGAGNLISGNDQGIYITGTSSLNVVQGNLIGTNVTGTKEIRNRTGVSILQNADRNIIGGSDPGAGNVISGSWMRGMIVFTSNNTVQGNKIGTDITGTQDLGNASDGIFIAADDNSVSGNTISYNGRSGVWVSQGTGNSIEANTIFDNTDEAISLDNGGNGEPETPTLTAATVSENTTTIEGTVNSAANSTIRIEFFANPDNSAEGETFLGFQNVTTDNSGNVTFSADFSGVAAGQFVTATVTDADGNTSEFSQPVIVSEPPSNVVGNTYFVSNTNDSGSGSLRDAIEYANSNPDTTIEFDIPTTDPNYNSVTGAFTIRPLSGLPEITEPVVIDGTSQPGYTDKPIVELDGSLAGNGVDGLHISAGNSKVKGLVINRFSLDGIRLTGDGGSVIEGNYLGTDVTGTKDLGNTYSGISIWTSNNTIGGTTPDRTNVISGNGNDGIYISGDGATGNVVQGNYIGTDLTGNLDLGNTYSGVAIWGASNNTIGGTKTGAQNFIHGNGKNGVFVNGETAVGNSVLTNIIFGNDSIAIDLGDDGETANDIGDSDVGANNLQNSPVLSRADWDYDDLNFHGNEWSLPVTDLSLEFDGQVNETYRIEFFANSTNKKEGATFLGSKNVTLTPDSFNSFTGKAHFDFDLPSLEGGQFVTATVTNADGDTSEFASPIASPEFMWATDTRVLVNEAEIDIDETSSEVNLVIKGYLPDRSWLKVHPIQTTQDAYSFSLDVLAERQRGDYTPQIKTFEEVVSLGKAEDFFAGEYTVSINGESYDFVIPESQTSKKSIERVGGYSTDLSLNDVEGVNLGDRKVGTASSTTDDAGNRFSIGFNDNYDYEIRKYDSQNQLLWTTSISDLYTGFGYPVEQMLTDSAGNVYLAGSDNSSTSQGWLVKYDANGNRQWLKNLGINVERIAIDQYNRIYAGVNDTVYKGAEIYQYDSDGNFLWKEDINQAIAGYVENYYIHFSDLAVDDSGTLYVLGASNDYYTGSSWLAKYGDFT